MNLTAIKDEDDFLYKMVLDSVLITKSISISSANVLDIGTGAGFPGLPLAIMLPSNKFVLLDATKKKCNHIVNVINKLGLDNVEVVCARAEEYVCEHREVFDIVTARAVADLRVLVEICSPALKVGGYMLAYKGASVIEELRLATNALKTLNLAVVTNTSYLLPGSGAFRYYSIIQKTAPNSEEYPRKYSVIVHKPL